MKTDPKFGDKRMTIKTMTPDTSVPTDSGCTCGQSNMATHDAMCRYCWQLQSSTVKPAAVKQRHIS